MEAWLDDLVGAGGLLGRCAGDLARIAADLGRLVADPAVQATGVLAPVTLAVADGRVSAAIAGPHGLLVVAARLRALGVALRAAAEGYRTADAAAAGAVHEAELIAGAVAGRAAPALVPLLVAGATGLAVGDRQAGDRQAGDWQTGDRQVGDGPPPAARRLLDLMGEHGTLTEHLVAATPGFLDGLLTRVLPGPGAVGASLGWPLRDVPDAAAAAGRFGVVIPGLRDPCRVEVMPQPVRPTRPPRDLAELATRIAGCYPGGRTGAPDAGTATVRVDRVVGADGRRAWVVAVPGQQQLSLAGGTNPFDLAGDVRGMARQDTAARHSVLAAMRVAGIPPDEPVLVAGHSQGGMVAASLAADPQVRARYRITQVVTVGSPIAGFGIPDGVQVLAVEHRDDAVPLLDGRANPDRSGWITVRRTAHAPGAPVDALAAHDLDRYRETLRQVDRSDDPSLQVYRSGLEPFLDRPGARSWSIEVRACRPAA